MGADANPADWNRNHRPLNRNVFLSSEHSVKRRRVDIVIVRSPINASRSGYFHRTGAKGIAVVQTIDPFRIPSWVRHVVWNSYDSMKIHSAKFPGKKHYYIPHGYSPVEFCDMAWDRNNHPLTVVNAYRKRSKVTGYSLWKGIRNNFPEARIVGHGNEDIGGSIRQASTLNELLNIYNSYGIYVNTTIKSAMPRSRVEAAMCGMPIVSTDNYGIRRYFEHNKSAMLSNNKGDLLKYVKMLSESSQMRVDFGCAAREVAVKHFSLKKYLSRWDEVFRNAIGVR
jgi:glycosyltransferase involved in cell wall biosynthesis